MPCRVGPGKAADQIGSPACFRLNREPYHSRRAHVRQPYLVWLYSRHMGHFYLAMVVNNH